MTAQPVVPAHTVRYFTTPPADLVPGDLILVSRSQGFDRLIGVVERLHRPGGCPKEDWRACCRIVHACIVVEGGTHPKVSQEEAHGDQISALSPSAGTSFAAVHLEMSDEQRAAVVAFARYSVGFGYGDLSLVADLFNALFAQELALGWGNRMVCSTQACRALERTTFIPDRLPEAVIPAHLAWYFDVRLPDG